MCIILTETVIIIFGAWLNLHKLWSRIRNGRRQDYKQGNYLGGFFWREGVKRKILLKWSDSTVILYLSSCAKWTSERSQSAHNRVASIVNCRLQQIFLLAFSFLYVTIRSLVYCSAGCSLTPTELTKSSDKTTEQLEWDGEKVHLIRF